MFMSPSTPTNPHLSTWVWGQVKDNQQDDVMFVGIKMVAMVGKHEEWNTGKVVLRQPNQSLGLMLTAVDAL